MNPNTADKTIDEAQSKLIQDRFSSAVTKIEEDSAGCKIVWIQKEEAIEFLQFLKRTATLEFDFLADLTAYDEQGSPEEEHGRFVMVYNLYSPANKTRLRVKVRIQENEDMPTATGVWAGANWAEREVFDMFGIKFKGHPDLRRILMDIRWEGHPLRKDYPLRKYQLFTTPEEMPFDLIKD